MVYQDPTSLPIHIVSKPGPRGQIRWSAYQGGEFDGEKVKGGTFLAIGHPQGFDTAEEAEAAVTVLLLAKVEWHRVGC